MVVLSHCVFKSLPLHGKDLCLMSYVFQICYMLYMILSYVLGCGLYIFEVHCILKFVYVVILLLVSGGVTTWGL
jgi:hypothetical protein